MSQRDDVLNKKAVALRYDENRDAAPIIVASGLGYMAEKIVEIANDNGVPVYEDNSLATVLTQLDLGTPIPEELYQAIVDIYAYFLKFTPKHRDIQEMENAEEKEPQENSENPAESQGNIQS
ncbi:MAG: type III secretion protein [Hespellia sp.]|jgi:flagellar biosynthesis protein|nr:type III secretion protein [Hespellia sp.]